MPRWSNADLPDRYLQALETALVEIGSFTQPVGILLTGSVIHGNAAATSDLDVAILHDQSWRQRVQRMVNGVPVECFINSDAWWQLTLKSEAVSGRSPAAHFLARGVIIHDTDDRMLKLQHTAQAFVDNGPQPANDHVRTMRYGAVTTLEDGGDIVTTDPHRARWLLYDAIEKALHVRYLDTRVWIPRENRCGPSLARNRSVGATGVRQ